MGIVGVVFPIGTSVLGFWYSGVRMIYAMGRQNFLPKQFSYTNKYNQPTLPNITYSCCKYWIYCNAEVLQHSLT